MDIVALDFETYYAKDYGLRILTTQEYIMSDRFEPLLLSYKRNGGATQIIREPTQFDIDALELDKCIIVAHNAIFDASILSLHYNVRPAYIFDTLGMARALGFGSISGCSLGALAVSLRDVIPNMPQKGKEVVNMLGLRASDLTPTQWAAYSEYCKTDTDISWLFLKHFLPLIKKHECDYQDMIIRCATEPRIMINGEIIQDKLVELIERRESMATRLGDVIGVSNDDVLKTIMSNARFAEALTKLARMNGHSSENIVPMKLSAKTGKMTYAMAKTDAGMQELLEHHVEDIALLAATRLGLKTTAEHTRLEKFLSLSKLGALSIPYNISGARTGRLSGANGINLQNLPAGDGRVAGQANTARRSLEAPDGYMLVSGDSKQIETRILGYIAGDRQALKEFEDGLDPYLTMAASIYDIPYEQLAADLESDDPEIYAAAKLKRQIAKSARLGCGFQLGPAGFVNYTRVMSKIDISEDDANDIVFKYRRNNPHITNLWAICKDVLIAMMDGKKGYFGGLDGKLFYYDGSDTIGGKRVATITLPDGYKLCYYDLRYAESKKFDGLTMVYTYYKGNSAITAGIYGGKLVENLVQALAFAVMKFHGLQLEQDYNFKIVSNTHDEFTACVSIKNTEKAAAIMKHVMNKPPYWLPDCPLGSDVGYAKSYADT